MGGHQDGFRAGDQTTCELPFQSPGTVWENTTDTQKSPSKMELLPIHFFDYESCIHHHYHHHIFVQFKPQRIAFCENSGGHLPQMEWFYYLIFPSGYLLECLHGFPNPDEQRRLWRLRRSCEACGSHSLLGLSSERMWAGVDLGMECTTVCGGYSFGGNVFLRPEVFRYLFP